MATTTSSPPDVDYPSGDGKPVAETPIHRDVLLGLVDLLKKHFAPDPTVYVSGNMLVYYVPGDKRRHVSPDVWMARGVMARGAGDRIRDYYLVWEELRGPEMVIEVTSPSTKREDLEDKFALYRDVLRVTEYFLFDPKEEYLVPSLRGYRLIDGQYVPIQPVAGRLPSEVSGFHLERSGQELRLYDPASGRWLPTSDEVRAEGEVSIRQGFAARAEAEANNRQAAALRLEADQVVREAEASLTEARRALQEEQARRVEAERALQEGEVRRVEAERVRRQEEAARLEAERSRQQSETARLEAETELDRLRKELEDLRRGTEGKP